MNKNKINLIIDALLLLCMAVIAGIGLLMRNVLVPGYKRWDIYGSNVELSFWGFDRHQWGNIHFIIGLALLGLLILHIVLHWSIIVAIYRKLLPNAAARWITAIILLVLTMVLVFFSYAIEPDKGGKGKGRGWQLYEPQIYSTQKR
jgi:glucan phosphoethanolaminetransferase (alkaline phosphatase superfamily)